MPLFPTELTSERLRYERVYPGETDPYEVYGAAGHHADRIEETTAYLTWEPHETPKESQEFVAFAGEQFDADDGAHYVLRPKQGEDGADEFAGTTGLSVDWERQTAELGIWLRPRFWGRGYAGERAARFFDLAFDRLDLALVTVAHDARNEQSRRAIQRYVDRFGGRKEGRLRNGGLRQDGTPYDLVRYSVSREEWANARE
ncbi:GNAT family N-acetyltransferase [Halorarius litoreus]|uniref:GNAT family N-acetyltransferase n=1 Tax=Halorarius litoreus TaxID=2962676 RepID=UPI0020CF2747|nr:GNAT family protein [Halorarius litoreus]